MQYQLFNTDNKTKELQHIELSRLSISRLNPRSTRPQEYIDKLTRRIEQNGFEITRALWVYEDDDGYKVFAGGTRLQSAQAANLTQVPCVVHIGFTEEEIVRLADEDNENDEYHAPVSLVDVWMNYKALADAGWTPKDVMSAKRCDKNRYYERVQFANFLQSVLDRFSQTELLNESHARELLNFPNLGNLAPWLTPESTMLWIIDNALKKEKPTAKDFAKYVSQINELVQLAESYRSTWEEKWFTLLLKNLQGCWSESTIRHEIDAIINKIAQQKRIDEELARRNTLLAESEREQAEAELRLAEERQKITDKVQLGDFRDLLEKLPDNSVDLIFTDPPYDEQHIPDYSDLSRIAARILKPGGSLIAYVGHYALLEVGALMSEHLTFWWPLVLQHSGGAARLPGKWVFVHYKPMLWFTKDGRMNNRYVADMIKSTPTDKSLHVWQQDTSEAIYCIEQLTDPGGLVIDPFCGSGTTAVAAYMTKRDFWTCDIDKSAIETAQGRLLSAIRNNTKL